MRREGREAILYERLEGGAVRCSVCLRRCRIPDGGRGFCLTRANEGGRLYSTIYGAVHALHRAPIEMKPVYHYLPGSHALSMGSVGCNFLCPGCQNWELSYALKEGFETRPSPPILLPEEAAAAAVRLGCRGLSWTYNEPTLWLEYTIDTARLVKGPGGRFGGKNAEGSARASGEQGGLYTNYVTNGGMTPEALEALGPWIDVMRVDVKGFSRRVYEGLARLEKWEGILENAKAAKFRWGMHLELVTNVIPGVNDDPGEMRALAAWIASELGEDTPWHVTRFFPRLRMKGTGPTPIRTLEEIRGIARGEGLRFVYLGNLPDPACAETACPACGTTVIERFVQGGAAVHLVEGRCPRCGVRIPGRFEA